jgi:glycosyltransferase involved in cell wall biosynthesis
MRVGFDLHVMDGIFQGSRTHVIEVFSRVARLCPEFEFVALLNGTERLKTDHPRFDLPNVKVERLNQTGAIRRLMWELPRKQIALKLDLLHLQYVLPLPSLSRTVVTIHDVLFESHPEYFTRAFRLRSRILMRLAARQAQHVFTVSEFSKREICNRYHISPDTVSVTPNSADMQRFYPGNDGVEHLTARGLEPGKYLLSVGRLEPRKNHVNLVKAYLGLGPQSPKLVIAGQRDFGYEPLMEILASANATDKVVILENIDDNELPSLYRNSLAFVYPSMAEGFGMPPLEAMASGVPVIASNNTGLTEVVGKAGILVSTTDVIELRQAMKALIQDATQRERLSARGLERARAFSWDHSAEVVAQRYRQIAQTTRQF